MTDYGLDGEHKVENALAWAVVWVKGELYNLTTFEKVSTFLGKNVKDPNAAKVFQGTADGEAAVYIVYRQ